MKDNIYTMKKLCKELNAEIDKVVPLSKEFREKYMQPVRKDYLKIILKNISLIQAFTSKENMAVSLLRECHNSTKKAIKS